MPRPKAKDSPRKICEGRKKDELTILAARIAWVFPAVQAENRHEYDCEQH